MIPKIIRSILEGSEDAKATIAQRDFLAAMASIERLSPDSQELIAFSVERVMENLAKDSREYLPEQYHQDKDYLLFVDSKGLKLLAEHYFSKARVHKGSADITVAGAGVALELAGYYLLSRSWQDFNHTINIDALGNSATLIGLDIEQRVHVFLKKYGRSLPRSC